MAKSPKSKFILQKRDRITSISIFAIIILLIVLSAFIAGVNFEDRNNVAAAAYQNEVKDCVMYNDDITITSQTCDEHTDCDDNGFCFLEFGRCANFRREVFN